MFSIYVDDFAIVSSNKDCIDELCHILKAKYIITETEDLETFLGVRIEQEDGHMYLSQPGHIEKLAHAADIDLTRQDTEVVKSPMRPDFKDTYQNEAPLGNKPLYQTLLGMLIFVLKTRPDIAYAVNRLATRSIAPTTRDMDAILRVIKYLVHTADIELVYANADSQARNKVGELFAYTDAAYLTHRDSKSHSGVCFSYGKNTGMFYSRSSKQSVVATSSTEAELFTGVECTKEVLHFRDLLRELNFSLLTPTVIYTDSKSMITLATKFSGHTRKVKHFLMRLNFLIEHVQQQDITFEYIASEDLTADVLTKPLVGAAFERHRDSLMGAQRKKTKY